MVKNQTLNFYPKNQFRANGAAESENQIIL